MKCKLSDICSFRKGKIETKELNEKNYISTENMIPNKQGITNASSLPKVRTVSEFKKGDVLVSNIRPYFKKIWIAEYDGGCSNDILVFKANKGINNYFLYYLISDDAFFEYATVTAKGTKMPRGDKSSIMSFEVPDFDMEKQLKIASILKSIDDKIKINNKINNNLIEIAMQLYKNWFLDFIPFSTNSNIPNGWKLGKISDIVNILDSKRKPISGNVRDKMKKIYPYYGAASLMDYVDDYLFDGVYLLLGEDGTVMDSNGFPILQYVEGKFWVNNHAHILEGKNGFSVEMLFLLFSLTNIKSIVTGAVQPKISQSNLKNIDIFIPPKDVLYEFDTIIQPVFSKIRSLRNANKILSNIRDSLITNLLSGKIDVSNIDI